MVAAFFFGLIATALVYGLGTSHLGWTVETVVRAILASNLAAWCCLPTTLLLERVSWFKKNVIPNWMTTWLMFVAIYFGVLLALVPELRALRAFAPMILPVIFTTGFTLVVYGPIHDYFIRRSQRRMRARARITLTPPPAGEG